MTSYKAQLTLPNNEGGLHDGVTFYKNILTAVEQCYVHFEPREVILMMIDTMIIG